MIEVLLALVVIAIGMSSVLGLFPVGLNASRNSIAENVSADVADQMVTYLRVMGESSATAYDSTFITSTTNLPEYAGFNFNTAKTTIDIRDGASFNIKDQSDNFLTDYKSGSINPPGTATTYAFTRVATGWAIFKPAGALDLRRRVYFIVQGPNCTEDGGNRNIDYSAMALVWKSSAQIMRLESDGTTWSLWPSSATDYSNSGTINIELSWPLVLPYSQRKKRYYQIVISKPE